MKCPNCSFLTIGLSTVCEFCGHGRCNPSILQEEVPARKQIRGTFTSRRRSSFVNVSIGGRLAKRLWGRKG